MALQRSQVLLMGGVATAVVVVGGALVLFSGGSAPRIGATPVPLVAPDVVDAAVRRSDTGDTPESGTAPAVPADGITLSLPEAGGQDVAIGGGQDGTVNASGGGLRVVAGTDPSDNVTLRTSPAAKPEVVDASRPAAPKIGPRFDLARVDKKGATVIAGKSKPGKVVEVQVDGKTVAEVTTDKQGSFVALFDLPTSENPQVLTLTSRDEGSDERITSSDRVFVMGQEKPAVVPAAAASAPASDGDAVATSEATAKTGETTTSVKTGDAAVDAGTVGTDSVPTLPVDESAPAVILANEDGVRIIQPPSLAGGAPEAISQITLDVISYDEEGEVILAGRSASDRHVRVYVNNQPVKTGEVDAEGAWRLSLPEVDAGRYTLRVDEIDPSGAVTSRLETPFQKEKADDVKRHAAELASADGDSGSLPGIQKVAIQRGATLWALAIANYGAGDQYMQIFNANREFIRDPDLIYPGQIFTIPE